MASILLMDDQPVELFVEPVSSPSVPDVMCYLANQDRGTIIPLLSVSGSHDLPTAWVNNDSWPCSSSGLGAEHEIYIKTNPNIIGINNPAGGDLAGNISVASSPLTSLISAYQVDEVRKFAGSFPDSIIYTVRVLDEERVSYLFRDLFVFVLPDTAQIQSFIADCDTIDEIKWAHRPPEETPLSCPENLDPQLSPHICQIISPALTVDIIDVWDFLQPSNVRVGIIDSGIDGTHEDLDQNRIFGDVGYVSGQVDQYHGTWVAGIVAAGTYNQYGISGMANVDLYNYKFNWEETGSGFVPGIFNLISGDVDIGIFSGATWPSFTADNAAATFYNSNRLLVAGAGNIHKAPDSTGEPVYYPARLSSVVAVGGISSASGDLYYYNVLNGLDFTAHAYPVKTTTGMADLNGYPGNDHCISAVGTSLSAPIVAGAAAALLSYNPNLYNDDIYNLLAMSATYDPLSDPGTNLTHEEAFGHGLIQVKAALDSLLMNSLVSGTVAGYSRSESTYLENCYVRNIPNWYASTYNVTRYKLERDINFSTAFIETPHAWGRGAATPGVKGPLFSGMAIDQKQHCAIKEGSLTNTGCTLETYVYLFDDTWLDLPDHWYPTTPENIQWGYAALGKDGIVSVPENTLLAPMSLSVSPNPFNARARLSFYNPQKGVVKVVVYDVRGRVVVELNNGELPPGKTEFIWDGKDQSGKGCPSAVYFIRANAGSQTVTKSFVMVK